MTAGQTVSSTEPAQKAIFTQAIRGEKISIVLERLKPAASHAIPLCGILQEAMLRQQSALPAEAISEFEVVIPQTLHFRQVTDGVRGGSSSAGRLSIRGYHCAVGFRGLSMTASQWSRPTPVANCPTAQQPMSSFGPTLS